MGNRIGDRTAAGPGKEGRDEVGSGPGNASRAWNCYTAVNQSCPPLLIGGNSGKSGDLPAVHRARWARASGMALVQGRAVLLWARHALCPIFSIRHCSSGINAMAPAGIPAGAMKVGISGRGGLHRAAPVRMTTSHESCQARRRRSTKAPSAPRERTAWEGSGTTANEPISTCVTSDPSSCST